MKPKISSHLWVLGSFSERYVPSGYFEDMKLEEKLEIMSATEGFDGLLIFYPTNPLPKDPSKIKKLLKNYVLNTYTSCTHKYKDIGYFNEYLFKDIVHLLPICCA
ncbi:MAG: hypothetical protein M1409_04930 [Actinobacteria bacterium]|nr:hypothetical protein [Actinomycetota bacterium]